MGKNDLLKSICDAYSKGVTDGEASSGYFKHDEFSVEYAAQCQEAYFYGRQAGTLKEKSFAPRVLEVGPMNKKGLIPIIDVEAYRAVCFVADAEIAPQIAYVLSGAYLASINR